MGKKLIEAGWQSYRKLVIPDNASDIQVSETRLAFYSGASVLFESIMRILDPGDEITDRDIQTMEDIQVEIAAFGQELDRVILNIGVH